MRGRNEQCGIDAFAHREIGALVQQDAIDVRVNIAQELRADRNVQNIEIALAHGCPVVEPNIEQLAINLDGAVVGDIGIIDQIVRPVQQFVADGARARGLVENVLGRLALRAR